VLLLFHIQAEDTGDGRNEEEPKLLVEVCTFFIS